MIHNLIVQQYQSMQCSLMDYGWYIKSSSHIGLTKWWIVSCKTKLVYENEYHATCVGWISTPIRKISSYTSDIIKNNYRLIDEYSLYE